MELILTSSRRGKRKIRAQDLMMSNAKQTGLALLRGRLGFYKFIVIDTKERML